MPARNVQYMPRLVRRYVRTCDIALYRKVGKVEAHDEERDIGACGGHRGVLRTVAGYVWKGRPAI
jgi:hypothetical protein